MTDLSEPKSSVLIVDDNEDNLVLLQAILNSSDFTIRTASSVQQAKKILLDHPATIDLTLSDISMPDETGFDLLAWMRDPVNKLQDIPVLLITSALPETEHKIRGLSLGAVDYIVRPINNQELILRIRNALEHHKQFRLLRSTLESSQDMAMTGIVLAAANHEIRNIVGLISITGEQALNAAERGQDMKPGSQGFHALSSLIKMTRLLTQVSRDLNNHIHSEKIQTRPCNVRSLIEDVLNITQQKLHNVTVESPNLMDDFFVQADETRTKQILVNFLLNALDSISEKGPVSSGKISIRVTENDKESLQIRISDNGIGLVNPETKREFQPFQTTKAVKGGKGLGLWLCARLASAMGGHLSLESKGIGQGATSVVTLKRSLYKPEPTLNLADYLID